jgi:hypothetical protein
LLVAAGNPVGIRRLDDLVHRALHIVMVSESEPGARHQYIAALEALIGQAQVKSILAHETVTLPGLLGIQHRDVLQAIAGRDAMSALSFITWRVTLRRPTPSSAPGHGAGGRAVLLDYCDGPDGGSFTRTSGQSLV